MRIANNPALTQAWSVLYKRNSEKKKKKKRKVKRTVEALFRAPAAFFVNYAATAKNAVPHI